MMALPPISVEQLWSAIWGSLGGSITVLIGFWLRRKRDRVTAIADVLDEFHSISFIPSRRVVEKLRDLLQQQSITMAFVAYGFWPSGNPYWKGDTDPAGFNDHERLELLKGYYVRLAHRVRAEGMPRDELFYRLHSSYAFHGPLLNCLADEVERQISEANCGSKERHRVPYWVKDVRSLATLLGINERWNF